jgi:hypothetical protein
MTKNNNHMQWLTDLKLWEEKAKELPTYYKYLKKSIQIGKWYKFC